MTDAPETRVLVGVVIAASGTQLSAAAGDPASAQRLTAHFPAPPMPEEAVAALLALIRRAVQERGGAEGVPTGVGVAVAGKLDPHTGSVLALPQAPAWAGFPLASRLTEALGAPVRICSEVDAAALAEATIGAGVHAETGPGDSASPLLYVSLGRSVEAGIVVEGRVLAGAHGAAGRLGHVRVAERGPRCACGAAGHLDPIAASQAVVRTMIGRASDREESLAAMLRATGGRAEAITAPQVVALAEGGDPVARGVIAEAQAALALGLADAIALLDPALIVLAGPLAEAGPAFLEPLAAQLRAVCRFEAVLPPLVPARLGARAALAGALLLAATLAPAAALEHPAT